MASIVALVDGNGALALNARASSNGR